MRAQVADIDIEYELVGPEDGQPIVPIAGIFQQLSFWPAPFLSQLADAGLQVVIHDNRDVARLVAIDGMGHFPLAAERWATIADAVIAHALKN